MTFSGFRFTKSGNQTIPDNDDTPEVTFDTVDYDTDSFRFDAGNIACPFDGWFAFSFVMFWDTDTTGNRGASLSIPLVTWFASDQRPATATPSGGGANVALHSRSGAS